MRLEIIEYALPLLEPLRGPRGTATRRDGFVIALRAEDGAWGCGEAAPAWWVGGESTSATRSALRAAAEVAGEPTAADVALEAAMCAAAERSPAAVLALETACLDLRARRAGVSFAAQLAGELDAPAAGARLAAGSPRVEVNALLATREPEALQAQAARAVAAGYATLKLKLGAAHDDVERVRAVRRGAEGRAGLRLDANRAWTFDEARDVLGAVAGDDVEYVEEPLVSSDAAELAALARVSGCRLAADESLVDAADLDRLIAHASVAAVVLKPARTGGLARLASMAARARAAGLGVTLTDSIETCVGRSAVVHLAGVLCADGAAVGLGGSELLAEDLDGGPPAGGPSIAIEGPGLGVSIARACVR